MSDKIHILDPVMLPYGRQGVTHIGTPDGKTLCGRTVSYRALREADWETLHGVHSWAGWNSSPCSRCYGKAVLALRPVARFHYQDPFSGENREAASLKAAEKEISRLHGNSVAVYQVGPGDTNRIAKFVPCGHDPLP